ncbi:unnamed protein product [Malus baccata var. baccata]
MQENMLLQLLVEAINNGWRDANGIISKQTIEAKIVPVLNEKLGCKKIEDHVKNHMKTLKGRFQSICQLFRHSSEVSWDHVTKKLTASDESYPKSQDLMTIFGDGTAKGNNQLDWFILEWIRLLQLPLKFKEFIA